MLRRLRERAGYRTGKAFAQAIGWVASKVSRIENGRTLPSDADVTAWATATNATGDELAAIRNELLDLRLERDRWKQRLRHGHADTQRATAKSEHDATSIDVVELFLVPGLLQTEAYARAVFDMAAEMHESPRDSSEASRERIRRQDVLYDLTKTVRILVSEFALRNPIAPPDVMRAQLDRLAVLADLAHIEFGIIPLGARLPTITMHGYATLDDATVVIEVNHTEITVTDPDDVDLHRRITARLWDVAEKGEDARALLLRIFDQIPVANGS